MTKQRIEKLETELKNTKTALGTLITWLGQTSGGLGVGDCQDLLDMLNNEYDWQDNGGENK